MTPRASFEGRVEIELRRGAEPAAVRYIEPGDVARLLVGKTAEEAGRVMPALYSVCGTAQCHAAAAALEAASGIVASGGTVAARQCLTEMETLRENALRVALDWPKHLGETPAIEDVRPLMRSVPELSRALFGAERAMTIGAVAMPDRSAALGVIAEAEACVRSLVFGEPLEVWSARRSETDLDDWSRVTSTPSSRLLARVSANGWDGSGAVPLIALEDASPSDVANVLRSRDASTVLLPPLPETTMLSRHRADARLAAGRPGLRKRILARLIELSELPARMRRLLDGQSEMPVTERRGGFACAIVAAARGTLVHEVQLHEARIAHYCIVPPTRWNFAPNGVASRALAGLFDRHGENARQVANLIVDAIDPCVGFDVRVA
ncbi:MAG: nickel-dependent hydrogenase large subunit [Hyphomicrobiaceae bacterium]|nr:nickel-dependent hydrogenase large subunit [Hyphomicrobiaceae bacterium]